jgi:hypothetical protein
MHERSSHLQLGWLATDKKKHRLQGERLFICSCSRDWHNTAVLGRFDIEGSQMGRPRCQARAQFVVHVCERASSSCMKMGEEGGWCKQKQARQASVSGLGVEGSSLSLAGKRLEGGQTAADTYLSRPCL